MAPLGAITQVRTAAEAALPHGWQIRRLHRLIELWIAQSEGPEFDDHASSSGR